MENIIDSIFIEDNTSFFPVGFQYYRAPTPVKSKWERDLKKIKDDGFNTVKYWVQWRWNNPEKDKYYFEDIDELMDLAQVNNLKVILNLIFDVAPAWFYDEYPESLMVTNRGEIIHPRAIDCRQIGGAPGPCFHNAAADKYKLAFLAETVKRYANHPALYCWDLWNEPELTTGVKREICEQDMVCYCDSSIKEFRNWLKEKYSYIKNLNVCWQRNYTNWEQVEPPRRRSTYTDMQDWRLFFIDTITIELKKRIYLTKKYDSLHPAMCHTVPIPLFNSITCGSDDWELAEHCDMIGNSVGSMAFPADMLMSAARGKKVINSEIHAVVGKTLVPYKMPSMNEMLKHIFIPLARGIEGFVFWQYRPEVLGMEAPAWGSVDLEGNDTAWHKDLIKINKFLQKNNDVLVNRRRKTPQIGIYVDPKNEILTWTALGSLEIYNESLQGIYKVLNEQNLDIAFLREKDLLDNNLQDMEVIWMPPQLSFNRKSAEALTAWVEKGGLLICEPFLASFSEEDGLHNDTVPGFGLDIMAGVKQRTITSADIMDNSYHQDIKTFDDNGIINIICNGKAGDNVLQGFKYKVVMEPLDDDILVEAVFEEGTPAVFNHSYGKGRVITFASLSACQYFKAGHPGLRGYISNLLSRYKPFLKNHAELINNDTTGIRVDEVTKNNKKIIIVENISGQDSCIELANGYKNVFNVFEHDMAKLKQCNEKLSLYLKKEGIAILEML